MYRESERLLSALGYSSMGASLLIVAQGAYWMYYSQKEDKDPKFQYPLFFGVAMFLAGLAIPIKWHSMASSTVRQVRVHTTRNSISLERAGFLPWRIVINEYPLSIVSRSVSKKGTPCLIIPRNSLVPSTDPVSTIPKKNAVTPRQTLVLKKTFSPRSLAAPNKTTTPNASPTPPLLPESDSNAEPLLARHDIYFLDASKFLDRGAYEKFVRDAEIPVAKKVSNLQAIKNFFTWKNE